MKIISTFKLVQPGAMAIFLCILLMNTPFTHAQQLEKPRKCILVFGAHADDVESLAGGTFAKYIAMGYEGIYVGVINNLAGCSLEKTPYFKGAPPFTVSNSTQAFPVGAKSGKRKRCRQLLFLVLRLYS